MIDSFIIFLNTLGILIVLFLIFVYLLFWKKEYVRFIKLFLATFFAGVLSIVIKQIFGLPRPFIFLGIEPMAGLALFSSFPSSHTALAFALSTNMVFYKRSWGIILFIISVFAGLSRVVADVHYPTDFFFGLILGVITSLFFEKWSGGVFKSRSK